LHEISGIELPLSNATETLRVAPRSQSLQSIQKIFHAGILKRDYKKLLDSGISLEEKPTFSSAALPVLKQTKQQKRNPEQFKRQMQGWKFYLKNLIRRL